MSLEAFTATAGAFGLSGGIAETRKKDPDNPEDVKDVRIQQALAVVWSFVIAAYIANQQNSGKPYIYWGVAVTALLLMYEMALRDRTRNG